MIDETLIKLTHNCYATVSGRQLETKLTLASTKGENIVFDYDRWTEFQKQLSGITQEIKNRFTSQIVASKHPEEEGEEV